MPTHRHIVAVLILLIGAAGCQKTTKDQAAAGSNQGSAAHAAQGSGRTAGQPSAQGSAGSGSGSAAAAPPAVPPKDIDSKDILDRAETAPEVQVKHALISWKELAPVFRGHQDPRGAKRSNAEAAVLAQDIAAKLKANPDSIDALVQESSEDPGSLTGDPYPVKADSQFVPEFTKLALRLKEKEVGIVKTKYGYHVMMRVPPPPPDPLESADILARPAEAGPVRFQQVLIGWKDTVISKNGQGDPRSTARTKADADKLAKEVLGKARGKADMIKLMKDYSEEPGAKDAAPRTVEITPDMQVPAMLEPLKNLVFRLKLNEVGMVKTPIGWHIVKRVPPPPPDPLESSAILKREPLTASAKVKHILLGWKDVHPPDDEKGAKRDRAALEKLVKETVAKLAKGDKIEPLMAELSADPGSAKSGTSYDVTPTAGLVPPFKNLSLRLKVGEVGVVKTDFGIHIIQRTE